MKKGIILLLLLLLLAGVSGSVAYYFICWPNTTVTDDGVIYIRQADSMEDVFETLQRKGYVKNTYTLRTIAQLKKYPSKIKGGKYKVKDSMSNNELINMLRSGNQQAVQFTFNNIRTLDEFALVVARQVDIQPQELLDLFHDAQLLDSLGFTKENFIGMFIPNTYQIYWNVSAKDFMDRMHLEYRKFWKKHADRAKEAGLSPMDVLILASIIEEETIKPEEYPIIAGVYINRLKKNIPLAACPTLKFALGDFTLQRILNKHLEVESPYNTYKYAGLPPGPVRMPSVNVVEAVLNYQHHDYLFFCAKSDFSGGHHFSKTLRQHNEYARQYHIELNKRGIY